MTIGRIWRSGIHPRRSAEYRSFAESISLPMFEAQEGFRGVIFGEQGNDRLVITLWESPEAVERLNSSPRYLETVARIGSTGFISGEQSVETFEIHSLRISP